MIIDNKQLLKAYINLWFKISEFFIPLRYRYRPRAWYRYWRQKWYRYISNSFGSTCLYTHLGLSVWSYECGYFFVLLKPIFAALYDNVQAECC